MAFNPLFRCFEHICIWIIHIFRRFFRRKYNIHPLMVFSLLSTIRGKADISGWLCDQPEPWNGLENLLSGSLSWSMDPAPCVLYLCFIFASFFCIFVPISSNICVCGFVSHFCFCKKIFLLVSASHPMWLILLFGFYFTNSYSYFLSCL